MRITDNQEKVLSSLRCERLSENADNEKLIQSFQSERGSSLVSYFKQFGQQEDLEGKTTYYIIKDRDNNVLMFFSLKCGASSSEDKMLEPISRFMIFAVSLCVKQLMR